MFWKTDEPHGLPRNPFKSCVVPRPIGWISTVAADGTVNLAPYSFFNAITGEPPMVMFSSGGRNADVQKDSISNAEATGEFVCSIVSWDLKEAMNQSSAGVPAEIDEYQLSGLETEASILVKPPRVKASPIHLECTHWKTVSLPPDNSGRANDMCIGMVIGVYIDDSVLKDGIVDIPAIRPVARLGYMDYASVDEVFTMDRPE